MGCDECLLTLIHAHHTHAYHTHAQIAIDRIKTEKDKTRLMFLGYNMVILFKINLAQNKIKFPLFFILKIFLHESLMSIQKYHTSILSNESGVMMLVSE